MLHPFWTPVTRARDRVFGLWHESMHAQSSSEEADEDRPLLEHNPLAPVGAQGVVRRLPPLRVVQVIHRFEPRPGQ